MKESEAETQWVFMLDGDNTLWDTNMVFTRAQMAVLRELRRTGLKFTQGDGFKILRRIDDRLVSYYKSREYDFRALFVALSLRFNGQTETEAVSSAPRIVKGRIPSELKKSVESCSRVFRKEMRQMPPLFRGVKGTLAAFRRKPSVILLFSEGDVVRVSRLISTLSLERYFDRIFVRKKTYGLYARARELALSKLVSGRNTKVMVVGDLLDPDVRIGNRIHAITVLRLAGYKPDQHPNDELEKPDYIIKEIPQLLSILKRVERSRN